mgnify:CR=1 FL=1
MSFEIMTMYLLGFTEMADKLAMQEINQKMKVVATRQYLTEKVEN